MNFWKRAYLHSLRKKGKATLLCIILLIMATLMLTCISIYSATEVASLSVRQSLQGSFTVNAKLLNTGLNDSTIEKILVLDGITSQYNLRSYTQATFYSTEDELLEIKTDGASQVPKGYENAGKIVGNDFSEKDTYFTDAGFELIQGNVITPHDTQVALIHEDFADANNLSVGEYFKLSRISDNAKYVQVQVIGIFTNTIDQDSLGIAPSYDLYENIVFTDIYTCSELLFSELKNSCQYGDFYVQDPENLDSIIGKVKEISNVDWSNTIITKYDKDYQNAKDALVSLQGIVFVSIITISIISIVLLTLILTLWTRSRVHEIGVFLAMGISKADILLQQLTEVLITSTIAVLLSFATSTLIAQVINDLLVTNIVELPLVHVVISISDWMFVVMIGIGIALLSAFLSAYPIMSTKPKNILTQIS